MYTTYTLLAHHNWCSLSPPPSPHTYKSNLDKIEIDLMWNPALGLLSKSALHTIVMITYVSMLATIIIIILSQIRQLCNNSLSCPCYYAVTLELQVPALPLPPCSRTGWVLVLASTQRTWMPWRKNWRLVHQIYFSMICNDNNYY